MQKFLKKVMVASVLATLFWGVSNHAVLAQESQVQSSEVVPIQYEEFGYTEEALLAKVVEIKTSTDSYQEGSFSDGVNQMIVAEILQGSQKGKQVTLFNDFHKVSKGQKLYVIHIIQSDGQETFTVGEPYRIPALIGLTILFLAVAFLFGGIKGIRGMVSLCVSLIVILYVLIPLILGGYPPLLVSIGVSSLIIVIGSYITHGVHKTTHSAVLGMIVTVIITGIIAFIAVHITKLNGTSSEELFYLKQSLNGGIDIVGLLLGSIMIGLLGVLYDVAIGQAITVDELFKIAPQTPGKEIYERATTVGKGHIGALIDTLAIAYVGASLPLLLLFSQNSSFSAVVNINRDIFATEIVRTIIGSIGIIIAVPITTLIAVRILKKQYSHKDAFNPLVFFEKQDKPHIH